MIVKATIYFEVKAYHPTPEEFGKEALGLSPDLTTEQILLCMAYEQALPELKHLAFNTLTNAKVTKIQLSFPMNALIDDAAKFGYL